MQSFNTEIDNNPAPHGDRQCLIAGATGDLQPGACIKVELPDGDELAVYNVNGEYYATGNFCPHRGAPLNEGVLCGHVIECALHGWQFDVRSGECLTVEEKIRSYKVRLEEGLVKIDP